MHSMLRFLPAHSMPSPSMPSPSMPSPNMQSPGMPSPSMPFADAMNNPMTNPMNNPMHSLALAATSFSPIVPGSFDPSHGIVPAPSPSILAPSREILGQLPLSLDKQDFPSLDPTKESFGVPGSWQTHHNDRAALSRAASTGPDPNAGLSAHAILPFESGNGSSSNAPNFLEQKQSFETAENALRMSQPSAGDASNAPNFLDQKQSFEPPENALRMQQSGTGDATQDLFAAHLNGSGLFGVATAAMCGTQGIGTHGPSEREPVAENTNLGVLGTWPQAG